MATLDEILNAHPRSSVVASDAIDLLDDIHRLDTPPSVLDVEKFFNALTSRLEAVHSGLLPFAKAQALTEVVGWPNGASYAGGFLHDPRPLQFVHFDRGTIAVQLICRVIRPRLLGQGDHPLCGPHVVIQDLAQRNPLQYARFVIGLAVDLCGTLQVNGDGFEVTIGANSGILQKHDHVQKANRIAQADYIALAALRNDSSWLPYRSRLTNRTAQGATGGAQVKQWLEEAGYSDVHDYTDQVISRLAMITKPAALRDTIYRDRVRTSLEEARKYLQRGYAVILCGAGNLASFTLGRQRSSAALQMFGGHWMRAREIVISSDDSGIDLKICTWGDSNDQSQHIPWSKVESWYRGFICGNPSGE